MDIIDTLKQQLRNKFPAVKFDIESPKKNNSLLMLTFHGEREASVSEFKILKDFAATMNITFDEDIDMNERGINLYYYIMSLKNQN